jgi:hypothetical protein
MCGKARHRIEEALVFYGGLTDKVGKQIASATWAWSLFTIQNTNEEARMRFKETIPLYDEVQDTGAKSDCRKSYLTEILLYLLLGS